MRFGEERTQVAFEGLSTRFSSIPFWGDDDFEDQTFGMASVDLPVLISGNGDGALQDYLRLATGQRSVRDIMDPVLTAAGDHWKNELASVWQWEELASLQKIAGSPLDDCEILSRLHQRYEALVFALANSPQWSDVAAALRPWLASRPAEHLRLAIMGDHFGACYGANRMAALIVAETLRKDHGAETFLYRHALKSTKALHASCGKGCWGQPHIANLVMDVDCKTTIASILAVPESDCLPLHVCGIVVRHGIDPTVMLGTKKLADRLSPLQSPRHLP
jgi:hypothetical protein